MSIRRKKFLKKYGPITFEECVKRDLFILITAGVVSTSAKGWDEVDKAWDRYLSYPLLDRCESVVGRGLYILQLRVWWRYYNEEERNEQFLIMKSENLRPDKTSGMIDLKPVTDFLGISKMDVNGTKVIHATKRSDMANATKEMLRSFYSPFNAELKALLGEEWDNPW